MLENVIVVEEAGIADVSVRVQEKAEKDLKKVRTTWSSYSLQKTAYWQKKKRKMLVSPRYMKLYSHQLQKNKNTWIGESGTSFHITNNYNGRFDAEKINE